MIPPPDDALPDDPATLKAIILAQRAEALRMAASVRAYEALIQALRIRIAKLKRQKFGSSSEKIEREIEQLQLALEDLEVAMATAETAAPAEAVATPEALSQRALPRRRGKPRIGPTTVRERIVLDPGERCPDCGGTLRLVGDDVAEMLELVASQLKVIETARLKKSCRQCERIVQPAAPMRPIPRGMAGPGLLAHILVAKYDDHLPLYRQGEILARQGADIPRSTLIDWCGQAVAVLRPLIERIRADVMRSDRLQADDTPVRVLDPTVRQTLGKARAVKEGRLWVYVRDDRPWGGTDPPAAAYSFSPDRKGEHPQGHLARFTGILQADAYGGFAKLYQAAAPDAVPRVREAACWAHLRRDFHDLWKATGSPVARDALERIGRLYDIEREIAGQPAERRRDVRQMRSRPHAEAFRTWCERQFSGVPAKGDLARAIRCALKRWDAFTLFLEDGRVAIFRAIVCIRSRPTKDRRLRAAQWPFPAGARPTPPLRYHRSSHPETAIWPTTRMSPDYGRGWPFGMPGGRKTPTARLTSAARTLPERTSPGRTSSRRTSWGRISAGRASIGQTSLGRTSSGHTSAGRTSSKRTSVGRTSAGRTFTA